MRQGPDQHQPAALDLVFMHHIVMGHHGGFSGIKRATAARIGPGARQAGELPDQLSLDELQGEMGRPSATKRSMLP
jgi:hypothetical protein